ncbi:MAG: caspase family protein [Ardenticatenaceae bacterium]|nr:caspase family protein [Ardenticatenaceae bacterium]
MTTQLEDAFTQPTFDALTIEIEKAAVDQMKAAAVQSLERVLAAANFDPTGWTVKPVHPNDPNSFDLIPPKGHTISIKQAFDLKYALEAQEGVAAATALFETNLDNLPEGSVVAKSADFRGAIINTDIADLTASEQNPMWAHEMMNSAEAWQLADGSGIIVGHPDSGYIPHAELDSARLLYQFERDIYDQDNDARNPDERGGNHGLSTASVLMSGTSKFSASRYVIGTAPAAQIIPIRITRKGAPIFFTRSGPRRVRDAIYHAIDSGCHVISMSLGGPGDRSLHRAIQTAVSHNIIILAAAGNVVRIVVWPARYPEVIAVAACTADREPWFHSSRGKTVDITAPGHNVWRACFNETNQPDVVPSSGTSYAVAQTAGIAALWLAHHGRDNLLARYPDIPLYEVFRHQLQATASSAPFIASGNFGAGIVDAEALLNEPLPDPAALAAARDVCGEVIAASSITNVFDTAPANEVRTTLGQALAIAPEEIDAHLAGVEEELIFHILTNSTLRQLVTADLETTGRGEMDTPPAAALARSLQNELITTNLVSNRLRAKLSGTDKLPQANTSTLPDDFANEDEERVPGTIYALLVGIDRYPAPVRSLNGCVNDITHFKSFLSGRVSSENGVPKVSIRTLTNEQATRPNVIAAWRTHLQKAGPEDVALFYYSGHGSQQPSPPEFWGTLEPDNLDETLVCYDSRTTGWDLADKEMGQLIVEVAERDPHIVVILDCCHAGTGTRHADGEAVARRIPTDQRKRSLADFIVNFDQARGVSSRNGQFVSLPQGKHVVLSACRPNELAQETQLGGEKRGVFSWYLLDSLQRSGQLFSYRDVFKRVNALVRANTAKQSPQIEATETADLSQPFLGGIMAASPAYFTLSHHPAAGWQIDGGAIHGIAPAVGRQATWLALFPRQATADQMGQAAQVIGQAKVTAVNPATSRVQVQLKDGHSLNHGETYKAIVTASPTPPLPVTFAGEEASLNLVRQQLEQTGPSASASVFVAEATDEAAKANAFLQLTAADDNYRLQRRDDSFNLVVDTETYSDESAASVAQKLEHIARWKQMIDLQNRATRLPANSVKMEIISPDDPTLSAESGSGLHLAYWLDEAEVWQSPHIQIRLTNTTDKRLHVSLLALSQTYGIDHVNTDWLEANGGSMVINGRTKVKTEYWQQGVTTTKDVFKFIASTEEMDAAQAAQQGLDVIFLRSKAAEDFAPQPSQLEKLLQHINRREFDADDDDDPIGDWLTGEVTVSTHRPLADQALNPAPGGRKVRLNEQVTIIEHPTLQAKARLSSIDESGRDVAEIGRSPLPPMLRDYGDIVYPLDLMEGDGSRSGAPALTVLELFDVSHHDTVSAANPLTVELKTNINDDDLLLPIAYDEGFYLPLGFATKTDDGCRVTLERLPAPTAAGERSALGSIRILFQKLIGQRVGLEYNYPQLAAASVSPEGKVVYSDSEAFVAQQIASDGVQRILLYIHGIFGTTEAMAGSAVAAGFDPTIVPALAEHYDLILTYDYENLDTTIEANGDTLFAKLVKVGLKPNHGKTVNIVAHSMGGLVARWMIERSGGKDIVSHLTMVGTPQGGSPWSTIQDVALVALTTAMNGLTAVTWPLRVISLLIQSIEKFDVALDEMKPNSQFLQRLAASQDPGIPYTVIAGNTAIMPPALAAANGSTSRLTQMLQWLRLQNWHHSLATLVGFLGEPNDMAVSVHSAQQAPGDRKPAVQISPTIACDHLSFFNTETGLKAIAHNRLLM